MNSRPETFPFRLIGMTKNAHFDEIGRIHDEIADVPSIIVSNNNSDADENIDSLIDVTNNFMEEYMVSTIDDDSEDDFDDPGGNIPLSQLMARLNCLFYLLKIVGNHNVFKILTIRIH